MLDLPPDVVDDALCDPFESFWVSQHVYDGRRTERVPSSNDVFSVYSTLPVRPVDTFKTVSTGSFVALLPHVFRDDFFAFARVNYIHNFVSFLDLC